MAKMNEAVITVDGSTEIRSNCRRIKGEYYKVGDPKVEGSGQCYKVNGRYCRAGTGYIVYNHTAKEYTLANDSLVLGVVKVEGEIVTKGHFEAKTKYPLHIVTSEGKYQLLNEDVVGDSKHYRYSLSEDMYRNISTTPASHFSKIKPMSREYKDSLEYDCRNIMDNYIEEFNQNDLKISPKVASLAPYLNGLSFGIEYETVKGQIPARFTGPLGLIPLKDGSVAGLEYATIPYSGEKGLQAAIESCSVLNKFTKYDDNCSLHLHIGNIPRTEEFFLALFKTLCLLQDEIYELFPIYKKYNFGIKRKHYTKPLPAMKLLSSMDSKITPKNIKENFGILYNFLSAGQRYEDVESTLDNVHNHPSDPNGTRKWNIKSRYYWVNLIPLLFGNKKTVEFRVHTPTTEVNKLVYYLFICTSIVSYVKKNTKQILESRDSSYADLSNIVISQLSKAPNSFLDYTLSYINKRRKTIMQCNYNGDIRGNEGKILAPNYSFTDTKKMPKLDGSTTDGMSYRGGHLWR